MPYYDLRCSKCGKEINVKASMEDREKKSIKCPDCGENEMETIFSKVNIVQSRKDEAPPCASGSCCGGNCGLM